MDKAPNKRSGARGRNAKKMSVNSTMMSDAPLENENQSSATIRANEDTEKIGSKDKQTCPSAHDNSDTDAVTTFSTASKKRKFEEITPSIEGADSGKDGDLATEEATRSLKRMKLNEASDPLCSSEKVPSTNVSKKAETGEEVKAFFS